jgi:hypothetical protein
VADEAAASGQRHQAGLAEAPPRLRLRESRSMNERRILRGSLTHPAVREWEVAALSCTTEPQSGVGEQAKLASAGSAQTTSPT